MRLLCFSCGKSVTNELPNDTILRAIATCPECLLKDTDDALQQQVAELQLEVDSKISAWEIMKNTADRYKQQVANGKEERSHLRKIIIELENKVSKLEAQLKEANEEFAKSIDVIIAEIVYSQDTNYPLEITGVLNILQRVLDTYRARLAKDES
jgi:septal ring factor EnvC (AmiA/AmiB activator)